jgi:iron-sulfur cluster assembly protein
MMITITEQAQEHLKGILDQNPGMSIVLGVHGGGCAGFSYEWQLMQEPQGVIEVAPGVTVDSASEYFLEGATVELERDAFGSRLSVNSPRAQSGCGCGVSFNFDMSEYDRYEN